MNVERLHRILIDLNDDIKTSNVITHLTQVQTHLQNQINQPNQPAHQTNLVSSLEKLYESLSSSKYNRYSPSWKEIISEISGEASLGIELKNEIEQILVSNAITPAKALNDIQVMLSDFQQFQSGIKNTLTGLGKLGFEEETLEPGECELGYTIPRLYVENKLSGLKNELAELNFILNNISEIVTGEKQEHEVKTISSSDYLLYIVIGLQVANVLSKGVERILTMYKTILEIRQLRNELKQKGVPDTETAGVESHVNTLMESEIKKIAEEAVEEHYNGNAGRKHELENGMVIALNKLANRIDRGFKVEIRIEPLPEPAEEEQLTPEEQQRLDLVQSISESANNIEYIDNLGESILGLPEEDDKKPNR